MSWRCSCPLQSLVVYLLSLVSTLVFSRTGDVLSHINFDTQVPSISTEELVLPCHARCVLSRLRCNGHKLLLNFHLYAPPAAIRRRTPLISFYTVQAQTLCATRSLAILCFSTTSGAGSGDLRGFWSSMTFSNAPITRTGRVTTITSMNRSTSPGGSGTTTHEPLAQTYLYCQSGTILLFSNH